MPLSGATVRNALAAIGAVGNQLRTFDQLAAGANDALRQAPPGLTVAGAASFLATMAQESAYFRTTTEYGSGQRYAPYIGRTFEQVTWESNYRLFGRWCKARGLLDDPEAFVRDPVSLSAYRWAWLGGVWYFEANGLWRYANEGNHYAVSQGVNRGLGAIGTTKAPLHWTERNAMFQAFRLAGDALLSTAPAAPAAKKKSGGPVIPILLPATAKPSAAQANDSSMWPNREEVIDLGFVGGWHGRCMVRASMGHPGGRIFRAHFDLAGPRIVDVPGYLWPGRWIDPAHAAKARWTAEAPTGPCALMITYAAPGGLSLSIEWEH